MTSPDKPIPFFTHDAAHYDPDHEIWINVRGGASVCIKRTDEGIVVDVLSQSGNVAASTYAFFDSELYDGTPECFSGEGAP
jgi:hypothetical protein